MSDTEPYVSDDIMQYLNMCIVYWAWSQADRYAYCDPYFHSYYHFFCESYCCFVHFVDWEYHGRLHLALPVVQVDGQTTDGDPRLAWRSQQRGRSMAVSTIMVLIIISVCIWVLSTLWGWQ